jgi:phosphoribosyl 1,2-cyclic phosphodiesterase
MVVKIWGARGSIPVSGKQYLKFGGDTTCVEIITKNENIIIDAGTGIRRLSNKLLEEKKKSFHIILTHAHWDHILGFPFFKPIYFKNTEVNFYGCPFAQKSLKNLIAKTMTAPYFPVNYKNLNANIIYNNLCLKEFQIDSITIIPILLSHPNNGLGFKFIEDNKTFVFLTDNEIRFTHKGGLKYKDYLRFSRDSDLLIHDAEFSEDEYIKTKSWGHSTYIDAIRLAMEGCVKKIGLFHHNQERTDIDIENIVKHCEKIISNEKSSLKCFATRIDTEIIP